MRIEITAETDIEKKGMPEPTVLTGIVRFGLAGLGEKTDRCPTGEFEQLHSVLPGDNVRIRGDLARLSANLDLMAMQQTSVNGTLQAHQIMHNAQVNDNVARELIANRNGLKIHRP